MPPFIYLKIWHNAERAAIRMRTVDMARMLGEIQYDTGIPKYFYDLRNTPNPHGGLGQTDFLSAGIKSVTSTTTKAGTQTNVTMGATGLEQVTGLVGGVGGIATSLISSFLGASVEKKRLKIEKQIAEIESRFAYMTEKERTAAMIEIQRIKSEADLLIQQESGKYGLGMTQILAAAGVASVGLIGMFAVLAKN